MIANSIDNMRILRNDANKRFLLLSTPELAPTCKQMHEIKVYIWPILNAEDV